IMMVILGGMGNFAGAIVGAFTFEYVLHVFKDLPTIGEVHLGKHWQLWMGSFIVLVVVFAPRGVLGIVQALTRARGKQATPDA
ncbi:MAG TPA: branched-chain amino acid ABC transporter permease, partial [Burkholderiaceae bacterium]|nr:branched-chain amino acid ABC transporter permease [Burkholderiaceae bacterium]